tara:strand:+ start:160 stop:753 length:594 start_codon:yes stop_codon:yes gene_type:complete
MSIGLRLVPPITAGAVRAGAAEAAEAAAPLPPCTTTGTPTAPLHLCTDEPTLTVPKSPSTSASASAGPEQGEKEPTNKLSDIFKKNFQTYLKKYEVEPNTLPGIKRKIKFVIEDLKKFAVLLDRDKQYYTYIGQLYENEKEEFNSKSVVKRLREDFPQKIINDDTNSNVINDAIYELIKENKNDKISDVIYSLFEQR